MSETTDAGLGLPDSPVTAAPEVLEVSPRLFALHDIPLPYPGLRPFESWETEIFFGREAHTQRLLEILRAQRFLAVIGPSGSGKSSLVRAGMLPQLPRGRLGTGTHWRVATMRPGNEPIRRLARALLQRDVLGPSLLDKDRLPGSGDAQTLEVSLLEAELRRGPLGLIEIASAAARGDRRRETSGVRAGGFNLLVLVDQFEELFTYLDAGGSGTRVALAEEAEAFVNLLLAARATPQVRVFVVLTMRTDFLGQCVRFLELPDAINRAQYLTPRLTREEIESAIADPARHFGGDVDAALVTELINEVGSDPDQLPILQHALSRMWDFACARSGTTAPTIVLEDFNSAGGVKKALSQHADKTLAELSGQRVVGEVLTKEQEVAKQMLLAITEQRLSEAGGQTVRRPQSVQRIADWAALDPEQIYPVAKAFAHPLVNFVHYEGELDKGTVIDVSHEALIRQWERLRDWVTEEAGRASDYRRLRGAAIDRSKSKAGSGLLTGSGLASAKEWLEGKAGPGCWQPTLAWARRYALSDAGAEAEFDQVRSYVRQSVAEAKRAEKLERDREAEKRVAEEARKTYAAAQALAAEQSQRAKAEAEGRLAAEMLAKAEAEGRLVAERLANAAARLAVAKSEAAKRQSRLSVGMLFLVLLAGALAVWSLMLRHDAEAHRHDAEAQSRAARAQTLWFPIEFEAGGQLSPKATDALLTVARAPKEVVIEFLRRVHDDEAFADRFARAPGLLLTASVGPSPSERDSFLDMLEHPAPTKAAAAKPIEVASEPTARTTSARALAKALAKLYLVENAAGDRQLVEDLIKASRDYRSNDVGNAKNDWRTLADALATLHAMLPASRNAALAEALRNELIAAPEAERSLVWLLALGAISDSLPPNQRLTLLKQLRKARQAVVESSAKAGLVGFERDASPSEDDLRSGRLPLGGSATVIRQLMVSVARSLDKNPALQAWNKVAAEPSGDPVLDTVLLTALAGRLPSDQASPALERLLMRTDRMRSTHNIDFQFMFAQMDLIKALIDKLPQNQQLATGLELAHQAAKMDPGGSSLLAQVAIAGLIPRIADVDVPPLAAAVARIPPVHDNHDSWGLTQFVYDTLIESLAQRSPETAGPLLAQHVRSRSGRVPTAGPPAGAGKSREATTKEIDALVEQIVATRSGVELRRLQVKLVAAVRRAPTSDLAKYLDIFLTTRSKSHDSDQIDALEAGIGAVVVRNKDSADARAQLVKLMTDSTQRDISVTLFDAYATQAIAAAPTNGDAVTTELLELGPRLSTIATESRPRIQELLASLSPAQRQKIGAEYVKQIIAAAYRSEPERVAAFGRPRPSDGVLEAVTGELIRGMRPEQRQALRFQLLDALVADPSSEGVNSIARTVDESIGGKDVAAGVSPLQPTEATELAALASAASSRLPRAGLAIEVEALANLVCRSLAAQPAGTPQMASQLFELMKYPHRRPRETADTIRTLFKKQGAPTADAGLWALVRWARERFPHLDLDTPPKYEPPTG